MPGSGGKPKEPYRFGTDGVTPPKAFHKVKARYSEEARRDCVEGSVLIGVLVDRQGRIADVRVLRPIGRGLDQEAVLAVRKWSFRPGTKDGQNVAAWDNEEIIFQGACQSTSIGR